MSVGVGVGVVMLAREGLSFAALKRMEEEEEEADELVDDAVAASEHEAEGREAVLTEGRSRR